MTAQDRGWPAFPSGMFRVEIEGMPALSFAACRGLGGEARFLQVKEGGVSAPRLFSEGVRWEPILLERGYAPDRRLWDWFESGAPRDGAIVLLAPDGSEAGRWSFRRGRPARWRAPELDAVDRGLAVEAVEIVHEGVRWESR